MSSFGPGFFFGGDCSWTGAGIGGGGGWDGKNIVLAGTNLSVPSCITMSVGVRLPWAANSFILSEEYGPYF